MLNMEKNDEQITVPALARQLAESTTAKGRDAYDSAIRKKYTKGDFKVTNCYNKFKWKSLNGSRDVIAFTSAASKILQDFQKRNGSPDAVVENKLRSIKPIDDIIRKI